VRLQCRTSRHQPLHPVRTDSRRTDWSSSATGQCQQNIVVRQPVIRCSRVCIHLSTIIANYTISTHYYNSTTTRPILLVCWATSNTRPIIQVLRKVKGVYSWITVFHSYGTSLAIHMGSYSVTCHPTQVNAPRLNPSQ